MPSWRPGAVRGESLGDGAVAGDLGGISGPVSRTSVCGAAAAGGSPGVPVDVSWLGGAFGFRPGTRRGDAASRGEVAAGAVDAVAWCGWAVAPSIGEAGP